MAKIDNLHAKEYEKLCGGMCRTCSIFMYTLAHLRNM